MTQISTQREVTKGYMVLVFKSQLSLVKQQDMRDFLLDQVQNFSHDTSSDLEEQINEIRIEAN